MTASWIEDVTESNFGEKVLSLSHEVPVLVDFWAPWCGPCRMLSPVLEEVINGLEGVVRLAKVNTDENPELAQRFRVQGIPAVKAFVSGEIKNEFVGVLPEKQIRDFIRELVPSEADRIANDAHALEKTDSQKALEMFEDALRKDPSHPASLIGKLRGLVTLERWEEAELFYRDLPGALQLDSAVAKLKTKMDLGKVLKNGSSEEELRRKIETDPENLEFLWDLAVYLSAEGNYPEAFEIYLSIMEKSRAFKDDGARKAILELFEKMARWILS